MASELAESCVTQLIQAHEAHQCFLGMCAAGGGGVGPAVPWGDGGVQHSGDLTGSVRDMSDEELLERATDLSNRLLASANGRRDRVRHLHEHGLEERPHRLLTGSCVRHTGPGTWPALEGCGCDLRNGVVLLSRSTADTHRTDDLPVLLQRNTTSKNHDLAVVGSVDSKELSARL